MYFIPPLTKPFAPAGRFLRQALRQPPALPRPAAARQIRPSGGLRPQRAIQAAAAFLPPLLLTAFFVLPARSQSAGAKDSSKTGAACRAAILPLPEGAAKADFPDLKGGPSGFSFLFQYYSEKFPEEDPFVIGADRQEELIAEYKRTKDPETLDRITASLVKWLQSEVGAALRGAPYAPPDPSVRDDLLQYALLRALEDIERRDPENGRASLFSYLNSYIRGALTAEYYSNKDLIRNKGFSSKKARENGGGSGGPDGRKSAGQNGGKAGGLKIISLDEPARPANHDSDSGDGRVWLAEALADPSQPAAEENVFYSRDLGSLFGRLRKIPGLTALEMEILQGFERDFGKEEWESFCRRRSLKKSQLKQKQLNLFRKIRAGMPKEDISGFL